MHKHSHGHGWVSTLVGAAIGMLAATGLGCGDTKSTADAALGDGGTDGDAETRVDGGPGDGGADAGADGGLEGPHSMPLLADGSHLGGIVGFSYLPEGTASEMSRRWAELLDAGMHVGRVQLSWADLEPRPGEYDEATLLEIMEPHQEDGLQVFMLLETIDSEQYVVPEDLMDPEDSLRLADGMALDDPIVLARFRRLLDWLVPRFVAGGGFVLAVGNEPDNHIDDLPSGFMDTIVGFVADARRHTQSIDPNLAVTLTLTARALEPESTYASEMMTAVDVASFNYYCRSSPDEPFEVTSVDRDVEAMLALAGAKQVVIQELGCSAGWEDRPSLIGSSPEIQRAFFERFIDVFHREPRLRAAYVFTLVDSSDDFANLFVDPLRDESLHEFADFYYEVLRTIGLLRFEDGSARPAWAELVAGVGR